MIETREPTTERAMLKLNVGGVHYESSRETLRGPYFARMFGETMTPGQLDAEGRWFIDRDGRLFRYVLNYMRNLDRYVPPEDADVAGLLNEALYFQLDGLVSLLRPCLECTHFELFFDYGNAKSSNIAHIGFCKFRTPPRIVDYLASFAKDESTAKLGSVFVKEPFSFLTQCIVEKLEEEGFKLLYQRDILSREHLEIFGFSFDRQLYLRQLARRL